MFVSKKKFNALVERVEKLEAPEKHGSILNALYARITNVEENHRRCLQTIKYKKGTSEALKAESEAQYCNRLLLELKQIRDA